MRSLIFILAILFISNILYGQKFDNVWLTGNEFLLGSESKDMLIDFSADPPEISIVPRELDFFLTHASMCDSSGNLLLYSNGVKIFNGYHQLVENGDSIVCDDDDYLLGCSSLQGAVLLPSNQEGVYYLVHSELGFGVGTTIVSIRFSKIDLNENQGNGKVVEKNIILDEGWFEDMALTKHANGRDWWILYPDRTESKFYRLLFMGEGFEGPWEQEIGVFNDFDTTLIGANKVFSPNGQYYVHYDVNGLSIFNFDRCTGQLSNEVRINYPFLKFGPAGAVFSPNNRFLYISHLYIAPPFLPTSTQLDFLIQYDLWADDIPASADTIVASNEFGMGYMQLMPDGRIYDGGCESGSNVIAFPNKKGAACEYRPCWLKYPYMSLGGVPYIPNYRLGPSDGSPCDTLGTDNVPLANFRCERQDSTDPFTILFTDLSSYEPAQWSWTFGDNAMSQDTSPVHTFPGNGVYETCLTVSNANGEDTFCKTVYIGTTANRENVKEEKVIYAYPNPASDWLVIESRLSTLQPAAFYLFDLLGREIIKYSIKDWNTSHKIIISELPPGSYFWSLSIESQSIQSGKLAIIR